VQYPNLEAVSVSAPRLTGNPHDECSFAYSDAAPVTVGDAHSLQADNAALLGLRDALFDKSKTNCALRYCEE
jgi:hypothetical protein